MRFFIYSFLLLWVATGLRSQTVSLDVAMTINLGSHLQRSGIQFRTHIEHENWQAFSAIKFHFNKKGLGPIKNSLESVVSIGGSFTHGDFTNSSEEYSYLPFTLFREASQKYSYCYTYNYFMDGHNTSQGTGDIIIKLNKLYLIGSNDLLGNLNGRDQYRTGSFAIAYADNRAIIYSKVLMWTGQTRCAKMKRIRKKTTLRSKYGYKDNSHCNYSHLSHGIFSMGIAYRAHNFWTPILEIGRDAEQIRNTVQNKLIHDMPFIPSKWNSAENLHIPMIDTKGNLYLYKKDQEIKSSSWFLQLGMNDGIFY